MPVKRKALLIKSALKSATRIPLRAVGVSSTPGGGRGSGRDAFSPVDGEHPIVILRLQIVGCKDLLAKDKNGLSDPFVVASILNTRHSTPVIKKTISPSFNAKDATFDFPIYLSLADKLGVLELVVWDKDLMRKDYLGEVSLPLDNWFAPERAYAWDDAQNTVFDLNLVSTRAGTNAQGTIQIKLGFVSPPNTQNLLEFSEVFGELVKRSRPSLVSAAPTEGVGTVRSHPPYQEGGEEDEKLEDDGGISSDSDDDSASEAEAEAEEDEEYENTPTARTATSSALYTIYSPPQDQPKSLASAVTGGAGVGPGTPIPGFGGVDTPTPPASASASVPKVSAPIPSPLTPTLQRTQASNAPPPRSSSPGFRMRFRRSLSSGVVPSLTPASSEGGSSTLPPPSPSTGMGTSPGPLTPGTPGTPNTEKKKRFRRSWSSSGAQSDSAATPTSSKRREKRRERRRAKEGYRFGSGNDIVGIVMLEIKKADDLPKLRNMTRTGWDMDPFVVISFGKKIFRTRVIRHSLNPVWDERLLFHVRRYEANWGVQLTILDWDKLSSNDYIGDTKLELGELICVAPQPDPETGLYNEKDLDKGVGAEKEMKEFVLPLKTSKDASWEARHNPTITVRASYQPYAALRQQFWRTYLKGYDTDDTGTLSHLEITSMLDSLGSTLSRTTIDSFFTRFGKEPQKEDLSMDETVRCLETELGRPQSEKRRVHLEDLGVDTPSVSATPLLNLANQQGRQLSLDELDFSGPPLNSDAMWRSVGELKANSTEPSQKPILTQRPSETTESGSELSSASSSPTSLTSADESDVRRGWESEGGGDDTLVAIPPPVPLDQRPPLGEKKKSKFRRSKKKPAPVDVNASPTSSSPDDSFERVINVRNCPLCHRPRLNSKAEVDIITHLAVCASQDWNRVDRIVVGNFVTASQAQRKWYTKIIGKISAGDYKLGANSANIIVQNRLTGQLEEEKMQVYVRLGIRLLYKGAKSRMEGARARRLLKSLSIKQGVKYDDPESRQDIPAFLAFHNLDVGEILDPLDSFKTFNEFFYRKLKPTARPLEEPNDPYRLVSTADCRFMAFSTVSEATKLWIKGREFTVQRLLGERYKDEADKYVGGALCIFRLAPQDYHRFHSPVDGKVGNMHYIAGEYYTVNPQAIRTTLDVYGENARKIVPIDSPQFGRVMAVCIGAMMVGSIVTTVEEGQQIKRGQEFGYFAFGGSTIVVLFEKDKVEWDEDLVINGRASLETLVRVGMGIGRGRKD